LQHFAVLGETISHRQQAKIIELARRKLAPRRLSEVAIGAFAAKLSGIRTVTFSIMRVDGQEARLFSDSIETALTRAGWQETDWQPSPREYRTSVPTYRKSVANEGEGVFVIANGAGLPWQMAAQLLAKEISDRGIAAYALPATPVAGVTKQPDTTRTLVMVFAKP
jgi:hypothetical protein